MPVISLTLVAGEGSHVARITLGAKGDSLVPISPSPIDSQAVRLAVFDQLGTAYPLVAQGDGVFLVTVEARAGETFRLLGTIGSMAVSASTTLPLEFVVASPDADTITEMDGTLTLATLMVPFVFEAVGATAFEVRTVVQDGGGWRGTIDRPMASVHLPRATGARPITFLAYSPAAADWLVRGIPRGNVSGAFGGFGGALMVRRWISTP